MIRNISKITASTLKYTASLFSQYSDADSNPDLLESCLKDIELGLDALFDDRILDAEDTFLLMNDKNKDQSPFHAYGYALFVYIKAILSFEKVNIEDALAILQDLEVSNKKWIQSFKKKLKSNQDDELTLNYELLYANCMFMSATLHLLSNSWIDNFKAAYDLRKTFKLYEKLFYAVVGVELEQYGNYDNTKKKKSSKRAVSCNVSLSKTYTLNEDDMTIPGTVEYGDALRYGIYFGIGLFNIVFLLLPIKVQKFLNSLGFNSSTRTALSLLKKSCNSQTIYASLSSLLILSFYSNISSYIYPQINNLLSFKDMLNLLNEMLTKYPRGKIWKLIEGNFKRLKGLTNASHQLYNEAKSPPDLNLESDVTATLDKHGNRRTISIVECTHFRALVIYEIGWSHIFAGNYYEASETFFCLESVCGLSRIFYHYVATCCLISNEEYDKAALEVKQITSMLEMKRKTDGQLSANDQYAEDKLTLWMNYSDMHGVPLKSSLERYIDNPIWELVYLWKGTCYWNDDTATDIKNKILHRLQTSNITNLDKEPISCLLLGVIYRDKFSNIDFALEYFNLILLSKEINSGHGNWILPYAMYEIAVTQVLLLKSSKKSVIEAKDALIITEWVRCIKFYYLENPLDKEWDVRMKLRCQILLDSTNCSK